MPSGIAPSHLSPDTAEFRWTVSLAAEKETRIGNKEGGFHGGRQPAPNLSGIRCARGKPAAGGDRRQQRRSRSGRRHPEDRRSSRRSNRNAQGKASRYAAAPGVFRDDILIFLEDLEKFFRNKRFQPRAPGKLPTGLSRRRLRPEADVKNQTGYGHRAPGEIVRIRDPRPAVPECLFSGSLPRPTVGRSR